MPRKLKILYDNQRICTLKSVSFEKIIRKTPSKVGELC